LTAVGFNDAVNTNGDYVVKLNDEIQQKTPFLLTEQTQQNQSTNRSIKLKGMSDNQ